MIQNSRAGEPIRSVEGYSHRPAATNQSVCSRVGTLKETVLNPKSQSL